MSDQLPIQDSTQTKTRRSRRRGGAILEMALLSPWVFLLFVGALDWGFYAVSLISLQAATRSAALYTAGASATAADSAGACTLVLAELKNVRSIGTDCTSNPLVTAESITGPDSSPASRVTVTYQTPALIPIPGLLAKQFTVTRIVTMRIRS